MKISQNLKNQNQLVNKLMMLMKNYCLNQKNCSVNYCFQYFLCLSCYLAIAYWKNQIMMMTTMKKQTMMKLKNYQMTMLTAKKLTKKKTKMQIKMKKIQMMTKKKLKMKMMKLKTQTKMINYQNQNVHKIRNLLPSNKP